MNIPAELKYTKSHEWVRTLDDGQVQIGVTDFAQNELGDLVYVNLPEEGDELTAGEAFADVESVKAVADVLSPLDGKVSAINEELLDAPEQINQDPYNAWFVQAEEVANLEELMDAEAYEAFCAENG